MKIALVTSSFLPQVGGAEMVVHNLALQWVRQGCGGWTRLDQRDSGLSLLLIPSALPFLKLRRFYYVMKFMLFVFLRTLFSALRFGNSAHMVIFPPVPGEA